MIEATSDTTLTVTAVDEPGVRWDQFVSGSSEATFCHVAAWRTIVSDVLGHECLFRAAVDPDGEWRGVLPLVRVRSALFGHYLVSMPFLNYGGPLGTPGARQALRNWAVAQGKRVAADVVELRNRDYRDSELPPTAPKITVLLPLADQAHEQWDRLPAKLRSQIRRPQKEGMQAAFGAGQLEAFYEVFAENMRDLGTPVLTKRLFERLHAAFGERVVFGAVYHGGRPVAGGCGFVWRDEFEMTWASSLRASNPLAPNMLLYWAFMEHMVSAGLKVFNFGRCTPGGGTHRFKRQWGGVDQPLPWVAWAASPDRARPSPESGRYRLASRAWQRIPVPMSKLIGPALARLLP